MAVSDAIFGSTSKPYLAPPPLNQAIFGTNSSESPAIAWQVYTFLQRLRVITVAASGRAQGGVMLGPGLIAPPASAGATPPASTGAAPPGVALSAPPGGAYFAPLASPEVTPQVGSPPAVQLKQEVQLQLVHLQPLQLHTPDGAIPASASSDSSDASFAR